MRISIPKGFHPLIKQVMQQIKTDDPSLAISHIISCWAAGQSVQGVSPPSDGQSLTEDDFSAVTDWS